MVGTRRCGQPLDQQTCIAQNFGPRLKELLLRSCFCFFVLKIENQFARPDMYSLSACNNLGFILLL